VKDLIEFLVRALECRLAEVNDGASEEEAVELDHLIEIQLAEGLTLADIAHLERAVEAGASGYITKPFEVRGLLEQIARLAKPSKRTRRR